MTNLAPPIEQSNWISSTDTQKVASWSVAVLAITLLAVALRMMAINHHSFWYDEAIAAELIHSSYADLYRGIARDNGNPPLYWLLAKAWSTLFSAIPKLPCALSPHCSENVPQAASGSASVTA